MVICITDSRLIKVYKQTQSIRKTGLKLGMSHETARCKLKRLGVLNKPFTRYFCDDDFFSRDNPESFYWAGFLAADGCVKLHGKKCKQISLGLARKDRGHLEKFKQVTKFAGSVKDSKEGRRYPSSGVVISSAKMFDDLARFNVVPRKTFKLTIPEWLIDHPLINHFMRGYNDGDGSFYVMSKRKRKTRQLHFSLRGTKKFLTIYKEILEKHCDIVKSDRKPRPNSGIYTLEYGGNRMVGKIRDFLYKGSLPEIQLKRKYDIAFGDEFINLPEDFKFKPVVGQNISTGEKVYFKSIKEAEKKGFCKVGISACCRGLYKYHRGYTWCFTENENELPDISKINVIRSPVSKKWTKEDINYLSENYFNKGVKDIARFLDRSEKSISKKAIKIGLSKKPRWTKQEIDYVKNNYLEKTVQEIATELERSGDSIIKRAMILGITKRAHNT